MGVKVKTNFDLVGIKNVLSSDAKTLNEIGRFAALRIESFTRSGRSLADNNQPQKLKPLAPSTIKTRKAIQSSGAKPLSSFFRAVKSNLTLTGQLLDGIQWFIPRERNTVEVVVAGRRTGDNLTNQELANIVAEKGRPFMGMDLSGAKQINNIIKRAMRRRLQAYNKKRR